MPPALRWYICLIIGNIIQLEGKRDLLHEYRERANPVPLWVTGAKVAAG